MKLRGRGHVDHASPLAGTGGRISFDLLERYDRDLKRFMGWLWAERKKKGEDPEFEFVLEPASPARSLKLNDTMWALYEVEADVDNGGELGPGAVIKEDLYDHDMREFAPVVTLQVAADQLPYVKALARVKEVRLVADGRLDVDVMITSSRWDTRRMLKHLDMLFNRLAEKGVPMEKAVDIRHYWREWRQYLNDTRVVLHDEPMSEEEYRDRQKICERCGEFVGDGRGLLAHISSRGSGVTWGPEKNVPADWLHLCPGCELVRDDSVHRGGWSAFLEGAPHLRFKVMRALKREEQEVRFDG